MHEIKVISKGRDLLKVGVKPFLKHINELVAEKSLIGADKKKMYAEEKKWLESCAKEIDRKNQLKVLLFVDGEFAGSCDVRKGQLEKERHNVHFGLSIGKKHRGNGYGEMLLRKGIAAAKKYFKPHKMWIEHTEGNGAAANLYKKAGFVEIARLKEYVYHFGEWRDKILMEYLK